MRIRVWGSVVLSVAVGALGACGSGGEATPLEAVRGASSETVAEKTAKLHMEIASASTSKPLVFDGAFDFTNSLAEFSLDASTMGIPGAEGSIDAVMDFSKGAVQYMKIPGFEEETGKGWMKIDLGATIKEACPDDDFSAVFATQSGDPTSGLQVLAGATEVKEVGTEELRGAKTTHYEVTIDVDKAAENAPEETRDSMKKLASFSTVKTQKADVWLDEEDRVRKLVQSVDAATIDLPDCLSEAQQESPGANMFSGVTTTTYEVYDFGTDVDIKVPAANDVFDLAEFME